MKIRVSEVRNYIRRLIQEIVEQEPVAALVVGDDSYKSITLYNPQLVLANPQNLTNAILGYVALNKHDDCHGAWEIKLSGVKNKGSGGLIYGAAFAATGGPIVPDRGKGKVSSDAQSGWKRQAAKGRKHAPLDNANIDDSEKATPNDPSDDCDVHVWNSEHKTGDPVLDQAWATLPQEISSFKQAGQRHEETMRAAQQKGLDSADLADEIDYTARNIKWIK